MMTFAELENELAELLRFEGVKHFNADEFMQERRGTPRREALWHIVPTVLLLEEARMKFGPIHVTNGFRDEAYNRKIGGKANSMHLRMNAADVSPVRVPASTLWKFLDAHPLAPMMGLGRYDTFVHIDTRGVLGEVAPARWDQRLKAE
jgi:uncharacterized protein YcbK (DUF882 family)